MLRRWAAESKYLRATRSKVKEPRARNEGIVPCFQRNSLTPTHHILCFSGCVLFVHQAFWHSRRATGNHEPRFAFLLLFLVCIYTRSSTRRVRSLSTVDPNTPRNSIKSTQLPVEEHSSTSIQSIRNGLGWDWLLRQLAILCCNGHPANVCLRHKVHLSQ